MADSGIAVSGLTATGGVGQIALGWSVTEASCLPYLRLDKVEIWEATANNRDTAVKVAEIFGTQYVRTGLGKSVSRRYWIRARDASGNLGEWFPESPTAGILGTTTSTPASASQLSDVSPNAGSVTSGDFSAVNIIGSTVTGGIVTGALIRTAAAGARIEISAASNSIAVYPDGGSTAAVILRAIANNTVLAIAWSMANSLVTLQNNGQGPTLRLIGNGTTPAVLDVSNDGGTSSGNDGARIRNMRTGGGVVFLGRPSGGGGYAVYAQAGGIGPFTGQHDGFILKDADLVIGDILVDVKVIARGGIDDTVTEVDVSNAYRQKGAIGIVSRRSPLDPGIVLAALRRSDNEKTDEPTPIMRLLAERYDLLTINSVGEGQVNVCGRGGNIQKGDLLVTSSMRGKAERQGDEVVYSFTVAKAREDVTFDYPDQVKRVACIYLCG